MICAVYARKSTEQNGADLDARSVVRQIESARAFAAAKGWTVDPEHVYADDAVSGADVKRLLQRQRLLEAIGSARAPFQALIMRDTSRFSRQDGDEAFRELKAIARPVCRSGSIRTARASSTTTVARPSAPTG